MKRNSSDYILSLGRFILIICTILSVVFLVKLSAIGSRNTTETLHMDNVSSISKTETTIAKEDFALSTARIVKFSFSEVLYLANSYGNYTPILNEDGTPMTLAQFEEVMFNGKDYE